MIDVVTINNLQFADDRAVITGNGVDLQLIVDRIALQSAKMAIKISCDKTEVQLLYSARRGMDITDTDNDTLLKFKQQTCMNRPIQLSIQ